MSSFPLCQFLVPRHYGQLTRALSGTVVWITFLILPIFLLLAAQISFMSYHSETVIFSQRLALVVDMALLWILWPMIVSPHDSLRAWWSTCSLGLSWRGALRGTMLAIFSFAVITFSLYIAVLPGEPSESFVVKHAPDAWVIRSETRDKVLKVTHALFDRVDPKSDKPAAIFHRNLDLRELTLVQGEPPHEVLVGLRSKDEKTRDSALQKVLGLNLADRDLRFANFYRVVLPKADLRNASLQGANLRASDLQAADLTEASLQGADLSNALLQGAVLAEAQLQGVDLRRAQLQGAFLGAAQLQGADLSQAQLHGANLSKAQLQGANLRFAQLQRGDLMQAQLQGTNLSTAQLQGANLTYTQLQGAFLSNSNLEGADLRQAQLQGADLSRAQMQGANLRDAQLQGRNLRDAQLHGANLAFAGLHGANLFNAQLQGANLFKAQLQGADLSRAQLQGANLSHAVLQGADLSEAHLQGSNLQSASIGSASFDDTEMILVDFRDVIRTPLDEKQYLSLVNIITGNKNDSRPDFLIFLKDAIAQPPRFFGSTGMNALCDEGSTLSICGKMSADQYEAKLAAFLGDLSCNDVNIARGIAQRAILHTKGSAQRRLAEQLLNRECLVPDGLPEDIKAQLLKIVEINPEPEMMRP